MSSDLTKISWRRSFGVVLASVLVVISSPANDPRAGEPPASAGDEQEPPVFSGQRAMALLEFQCDLGPRNPGAEAHAALQRSIATHADTLGLPFARLCFQRDDPYGEEPLTLCNLVIAAGPPGGRRLWLGAHYDTRPYCDRDPDPARRLEPLLGANDGASGVAVLLHLAELLAAQAPSRGVDLIFFDGEDYGREGDLGAYCMGSTHLALTWQEFGNPLATGKPEGLILLDMVGQTGLAVPMEGYSLQVAPEWTRAVFARASELGLAVFEPVPGRPIYDDHVPFLRAGIPAVDLIDFDFPAWHTSADRPEVCSAKSLEQVGRLLTDVCYRPLRH